MMFVFLACAAGSPADKADDTHPVDHTGDTGDTAEPDEPVALEELLAELRADPEATMERYASGAFDPGESGGGWPVPITGGYLFVDWDERGYLAGDFNDWTPVAMTADDGFAYLVHTADRGDGYKFTDGGDTYAADPWSRAFTYDSYGEISLVHPQDARLERLFSISGQGLAARDIHLYVPATPDRVLYAHDGQNLFDPEAMWGGWNLDETAADVAPNTLIVGIWNTGDRMEEYTHVTDRIYGEVYGGWGDTYADFVHDDVAALIADTYFGGAEPEIRGLLGSSLGGLISYHIGYRYPGEYAFIGSMSGTMGWGSIGSDNETMIERYATLGHQGNVLYLDSGGSGTCFDSDGDGINDDDPSASDNYCENIQLRDVLSGVGYAFENDLFHWWEADAEHNEMAWAERVDMPLLIFGSL